MRILTLCYEFRPIGGGGAKVAEDLIEKMLARGDEVDLVTMGYRELPPVERQGALTIHRVPCGRRKVAVCHPHEMFVYLLRALPLVTRLARERRPDINHTHFIFPDGVLAMVLARRYGLRFVVTAHGSDVPGYNPDRFTLLHRLLQPLWRAVVGSTSMIVCPSEYIQTLLHRCAPNASSEVIPNGINVTQYSPLRPREKRILVVSRLVERKGVQYLLRALQGLEHDYEVCVVGDGPYRSTLEDLASKLQVSVSFTGFIDNKSQRFKDLLETSEIFVFTSAAENFPIVLLEAMTAGLCIITANDTGCREVVGEAAIKIPPQDAEALRGALVALMGDPGRREALGQEARLRVESLYGQDSVAERYRLVYERFSAAACLA